jgi:SAM-dependent methyltransferase
MSSIGELFSLFFKVRFFLFLEERKVHKRYPHFRASDRRFAKAYRLSNPFRISRKFLEAKGEREVDLYGETPLTVFEEIGNACHLTSSDHFFELGCGRGRGALFISSHFGCQVTGVDWIAEFITRAQSLSPSTQFLCCDMTEMSFEEATAIYLYGTCLQDAQIMKLIERLKSLPPSTSIVTVSYPLTDYAPESFIVTASWQAVYPWGVADLFVQHPSG